jgi:hypothetical protein
MHLAALKPRAPDVLPTSPKESLSATGMSTAVALVRHGGGNYPSCDNAAADFS